MNSNVNQISGLIDRYKDFLEKHQNQRVSHFKKQFEHLLKEYEPLKEKLKEREKNEGTRFNVFEILNIRYAETRTHTPFLRNLLDPVGTHGQGGLFIESFIENFVPQPKMEHFLLRNTEYYDVAEEKVFPDGRIDLFIRSIDPAHRCAIVIENKIYAADQQNQISRYYDFLKYQLGYSDDRVMIFYLTVHGIKPSSYSIDTTNRDTLLKEQVLRNISYRIDIKKWLKLCYGKVNATNVQELIKQYLDNIDKM